MDTKHVQLGNGRDPRYYTCCCGIHVHKGALIIGVIGLIFSLFSILAGSVLVGGQLLLLPVPIISLLLYILVIVANKTEKPVLYLPFIVLNTIGVVFILIISVLFVLSGSAVTVGGLAVSKNDQNRHGFGVIGGMTVGFGAILFIWGILSAYFIHVVYRAYRYLKEVILNPNVALATQTHTHTTHTVGEVHIVEGV